MASGKNPRGIRTVTKVDISINGEAKSVEDGSTVLSLLSALNYEKSKTAVWVNKKQLLFGEYGTHVLLPGDELRIVRLFGGG